MTMASIGMLMALELSCGSLTLGDAACQEKLVAPEQWRMLVEVAA
jgi:hypothetical protein